MRVCILLFLFYFGKDIIAQPFQKLFPLAYDYNMSSFEGYDHGIYLFNVDNSGNGAKIIKTDVNGNILWVRNIYNLNYLINTFEMSATHDGGIVLIGNSKFIDTNRNVFVLKLNACGEKEWAVDYLDGKEYQAPYSIIQLSNGNYLLATSAFNTNYQYYFTLDSLGNVLKVFTIDENGGWRYLFNSCNKEILNPSSIYTINPLVPSDKNLYQRPCIVQIDSTGDLKWFKAIGVDSNMHGDASCASPCRSGYTFIGGFNRISMPPLGYVCKTNMAGDVIWFKPVGFVNNTVSGSLNNVISMVYHSDSTLLLSKEEIEVLNFDYQSTTKILLMDTSGNILDSLAFGATGLNNPKYKCFDIIPTFDGNFLLVFDYKPKAASFNQTYLTKINAALQTVNFDTTSYTYDWKCGHTIKVNDTINLDGARQDSFYFDPWHHYKYVYKKTGVNTFVFEYLKLNLYPNPVEGVLNIELPDMETPGKGEIKVYDMQGREVLTNIVAEGSKKTQLDISAFANGQYLISLLQNKQLIAGGLIIKN